MILKDIQAKVIVIFISVLVFFTAVQHLSAHGIWLDEGYSISFALANHLEFISALHRLDGPIAIYYLFLRWWLSVYSTGHLLEDARMLSVVAGVACIPAIYLLGREMHSSRVGVIAVLIMTCNPSYWARTEDIRVYSLVMFVSILSFWWFAQLAFTWRRRTLWFNGVMCGIFNTLGVALQVLIGGTTLLSEMATIFIVKFRPIWRELTIAAVISILGVGGFFGALKYYHAGMTQSTWIPHFKLWFLFASLAQVFGTKSIIFVFTVCGAVALWLNRHNLKVWALVVWVLTPIISEELCTIFYPVFAERYLLSALAPFIVLSAVGVASLRRPWALGLLVVVLAFEARGMYHIDKAEHEDWALVTPEIVRLPHSGDIIDVYPGDGSVGLIAQLQMTNTHLPANTHLFPTIAPVLWSNQWVAGNRPDAIPSRYLGKKGQSIWVIVRNPLYWPPKESFTALHGLRQCLADTSQAIHIYRFAKDCRS